jgi:NIF3 (NGG1p interacting factor 3)
MRRRGLSFYHVHAPLDQHPEVSPSRLCAGGLGLTGLEEYFPVAKGIGGGAAVIGDSTLTVDELAGRLAAFLGPGVPVRVLARPRRQAGRVAVAAGGGAIRQVLQASLGRGEKGVRDHRPIYSCRLSRVQFEHEQGVGVRNEPHQPHGLPCLPSALSEVTGSR